MNLSLIRAYPLASSMFSGLCCRLASSFYGRLVSDSLECFLKLFCFKNRHFLLFSFWGGKHHIFWNFSSVCLTPFLHGTKYFPWYDCTFKPGKNELFFLPLSTSISSFLSSSTPLSAVELKLFHPNTTSFSSTDWQNAVLFAAKSNSS